MARSEDGPSLKVLGLFATGSSAWAWPRPGACPTIAALRRRVEGAPPNRARGGGGGQSSCAGPRVAGELAGSSCPRRTPARIGQIGDRYARAPDLRRASEARAGRPVAAQLDVGRPPGHRACLTRARRPARPCICWCPPATTLRLSAGGRRKTRADRRQPMPAMPRRCSPARTLKAPPRRRALPTRDARHVPLQASRSPVCAHSAPSVDPTGRARGPGRGHRPRHPLDGGESFRLNEVLRTILDAMHCALGFRCVVFGLRDPDQVSSRAAWASGEGRGSRWRAQFRVDVNAERPGRPAHGRRARRQLRHA